MDADILVIEDDPDLAALTTEALELYGFRVSTATTFEEADYFLRHRAFEATIADLFLERGMDDVKSWRDVATLRSRAPMMPFGLLTGTRVGVEDMEKYGIAFALHKPVSTEQLVRVLTKCLPEASTLTPERTATLRMYFSALERGDWECLESVCTEDVTYELPADSQSFKATITGRAAFRRFSEQTFARFSDPRFAMQGVRPLPRGALVRYEGSWNDPSGTRVSLPGAILFRFEGDRIAEIRIRVEPPGE
ncbi:hypothetical protein BH11MYX3_BH11MYX3_45660 [soil metagenome]